MGLVRDLAAYGISRAAAARKRPTDTSGGGDTSTAGGGTTTGGAQKPAAPKRSTTSDLEKIGEKRLESGGEKRGGVSTSQYSVGSMGLAGSIPGQEFDLGGDMSNGRRKRSNGKRQ